MNHDEFLIIYLIITHLEQGQTKDKIRKTFHQPVMNLNEF